MHINLNERGYLSRKEYEKVAKRYLVRRDLIGFTSKVSKLNTISKDDWSDSEKSTFNALKEIAKYDKSIQTLLNDRVYEELYDVVSVILSDLEDSKPFLLPLFGIGTTPVFETILDQLLLGKTTFIERGGTRSSKTFTVMQIFHFILSLDYRKDNELLRILLPKFNTGSPEDLTIDRPIIALVTRDKYTQLMSNALEDFKTWLEMSDTAHEWKELKSQGNHHFTHKNGNKIYFKAFMYEDDAKGFKSDMFLQNEGNTQSLGVAKQLRYRRTSGGLHFIDFNPDTPDTWINRTFEQTEDQGLKDEMVVIQSSYLNNCFLGAEQIANIERDKQTDPNNWHIYGCGEYGIIQNKIFHNYVEYDSEKYGDFDELVFEEEILGIDFGAVVATGMVHSKRWEVEKEDENGNYYIEHHVACKCVIHQKGLRASDISRLVKQYQYDKCYNNILTVPDPAGAVERMELINDGIACVSVVKNVRDNIQNMRKFHLHIVNEDHVSANLMREMNNYKNKVDKEGDPLDFQPQKKDDHALDGLKYSLYHWKYLHESETY